jgi:hypothetical protein
MRTSNRLNPLSPPIAGENARIMKAIGKKGKEIQTDPALSGYAQLCKASFAEGKTQYIDLGADGMDTGIARMTIHEANGFLDGMYPRTVTPSVAIEKRKCSASAEGLENFLEEERIKLERLRGILTGAIKEDASLASLVGEMDYLYLHFPDSYLGFSGEPAFLKRVRIELEYFLKTLTIPWS